MIESFDSIWYRSVAFVT